MKWKTLRTISFYLGVVAVVVGGLNVNENPDTSILIVIGVMYMAPKMIELIWGEDEFRGKE